jgi:hypothetical protein
MIASAGVALAAPGDLDTSFSADGKQTLNFGGNDRATRVAILAGFARTTTITAAAASHPTRFSIS